MNKKIIILSILLIFATPLTIGAKTVVSDNIGQIENSIFGYDYKNESDSARLERIEKYIYGSKKQGNVQTRLKNIENDIGFVEEKNTPIESTQQSYPQNIKNPTKQENSKIREIQKSSKPNNDVLKLKENSTVEYPIVDSMEEEVFKTTYKEDDIYKRLDRLEETIFNKKSDASLNERVKNLSMAVLSQNTNIKKNSYTEKELDDYYTSSGFENIDEETMPFKLTVLEQDLFKNNYERDNISNRLTRLEQKLFKRSFSNDNDISRLQRIIVAYDAKKNNYKYENNRRMQNVAAASQLGGILLMILAILL